MKTNLKAPLLTKQDIKRFWSKVNKAKGQGPNGNCWEWTDKLTQDGYAQITLCVNNKPRYMRAHRISYLLHHGIWATEFVCHHCDNRACVRPNHLYEAPCKKNMEDAAARDRVVFGEASPRAKLTNEQVIEIYQTYKEGNVSQYELARKFGVTRPMIGYIVRGTSWRRLISSLPPLT